jgi:lincosamide nucleotidyltransferase A/C/D/E
MDTGMTAADVVEIVQLLTDNGIRVHVDGGWGVDALLGEQTRPHADLDIAVRHKDVPKLRELLESRGYTEIPRDDSWKCNFVLADEAGHEVDVHSYIFDAEGNNIFGVPYPADSLTGTGTVDGHQVECISPKWMVDFHTGYELDMNDYRDVSALCERFEVEFPSEYSEFREK